MVVYPTERVRNQFVQERVNKSVLYTPYYKELEHIITDEGKKKKGTFSVSLKHFGKGTIAYVGSESENAIISFAADDIMIDELPLCNELSVAMTPERQSDSRDRTTVRIGNPLITDADIHADYNDTDKKIWSIRCSSCGKIIFPNYLTHVFKQENENMWTIKDRDFDWDSENDINPICDQCHRPFDRYVPGEWVAEVPSRSKIKSGYAISKIFCTADTIRQVAEKFNKGLDNDDVMQRVYNADFGMPYIAAEDRLTEAQVYECCNNEIMSYSHGGPCAMGVDVGKIKHIVIGIKTGNKQYRIVKVAQLSDWNDIHDLARKFNVKSAVIDIRPYQDMAKKFQADEPYQIFLCEYSNNPAYTRTWDIKKGIVKDYRTALFDETHRLVTTPGMLTIPRFCPEIKEFAKQMCDAYKLLETNKRTGAKEYRYKGEKEHYRNAMNYFLLAASKSRIARIDGNAIQKKVISEYARI